MLQQIAASVPLASFRTVELIPLNPRITDLVAALVDWHLMIDTPFMLVSDLIADCIDLPIGHCCECPICWSQFHTIYTSCTVHVHVEDLAISTRSIGCCYYHLWTSSPGQQSGRRRRFDDERRRRRRCSRGRLSWLRDAGDTWRRRRGSSGAPRWRSFRRRTAVRRRGVDFEASLRGAIWRVDSRTKPGCGPPEGWSSPPASPSRTRPDSASVRTLWRKSAVRLARFEPRTAAFQPIAVLPHVPYVPR